MHHVHAFFALILACLLGSSALYADDGPWPSNVPGYVAPKPGEHPRLLFRRTDLPALRARAKTPEGKAILKRLRATLNGSDGESMPTSFNPVVGKAARDGTGDYHAKAPLGAYTYSHAAGFGMLYQLTGDKKYAELGRQCFEKAFEGVRDRDNRYAYKYPYGALRAGPSYGWTALGYDLCYDGWDAATQKKITEALFTWEYKSKQHLTIEFLVKGKRHFPASNHWGMQVGGGAMAALALMGDPGTDDATIKMLLKESQKSMIRNLSEGFGDGGYFAEGDGTGSMASHIIFLTALQAWKVAGGKDFISPRPNARWTALKWFLQTVPKGSDMKSLAGGFIGRGGYPHNIWARDGVSGGGYFSIGYASVLPEQVPGILWWYHQYVKSEDEKNGTPWDTPSPYPHHSILAFVNTPLKMTPVNPAECMPRNVRDTTHAFFAFRNRWKDRDDIVITMLAKKTAHRFKHGPDKKMVLQSGGRKENWGSIPADVTHWQPAADGSAIIGGKDGTWVGIDFSGASGAPGMIVMTGPGADSGKSASAGGVTFQFKFIGGDATPKAQGDKVVIGKQTISMQDGKLVFGTIAGPWEGASAKAKSAAGVK